MSKRLRDNYAAIVATAALVVALVGVPGVTAGGILVGSKQIRNGSILTQDIHKSGVRSSDLSPNSVQSGDIKNGEVESQDVTLPDPAQLQEGAGGPTVKVANEYAVVDVVGSYTKEDPTSILQVDWTGTARADFTSCIFQLRVDGQPSSPTGGEVYVQNGTTVQVGGSALFAGLAAGPHQIEVWAKAPTQGGEAYACEVGPAEAGVSQTFVVSEQVV